MYSDVSVQLALFVETLRARVTPEIERLGPPGYGDFRQVGCLMLLQVALALKGLVADGAYVGSEVTMGLALMSAELIH